MSPSPKSGSKDASRIERVPRPHPRLNPAMACDTAFRVVARRSGLGTTEVKAGRRCRDLIDEQGQFARFGEICQRRGPKG